MKFFLRNTILGAAFVALIPTSGRAQTPSWGQTFMSPAMDVFLQAIRMAGIGSAMVQFDIFETDGSSITSPSLFTATRTNLPVSTTSTFSPDIQLKPNTLYVLAMTIGTGGAGRTMRGSNPFVDGSAVDFVSGTTFQDVDGGLTDYENFSVTYAPVTATPEPATMSLMAFGLGGVAIWKRRRRKSAA